MYLEPRGTCVVAATVVFPLLGELTALPQIPELDFGGHFVAGEREGKGKKGRDKKR